MSQSEQVNELFKALSKVQSSIEGAKKDSSNPFFKSKYADLESVWEACRKPLTDNGFCVIQAGEVREGVAGIVTTLGHSSGQWIKGFMPLNAVKPDPQAQGSAITYVRRYALAAIVGIVQVDDDGESAMNRNTTIDHGFNRKNGPTDGDGNSDIDRGYYIDFGKWGGKTLEQIYRDLGPKEIMNYITYLEETAIKKNQPIDPKGKVAFFIKEASNFLAAMENGV